MIRRWTRRFVPALLLAALATAAPSPAGATRYAGEFLRIGVGARALGMGSAFMGLSDDGTAAYWNPAGLATLERREITAMHAEQFGSIVQYDFLSYVVPIGDPGRARQALGFSLVRLGVDQGPSFRLRHAWTLCGNISRTARDLRGVREGNVGVRLPTRLVGACAAAVQADRDAQAGKSPQGQDRDDDRRT